MLLLRLHADQGDAAPARGRCRGAQRARRRGGGDRAGRRQAAVLAPRPDHQRLGRLVASRLARVQRRHAGARPGEDRPPRRCRGRRPGAALRQAGGCHRVVGVDPADPRPGQRRVLDQPGGDANARGAREHRHRRRRAGGLRVRPAVLPTRVAGRGRGRRRPAAPQRGRGGGADARRGPRGRGRRAAPGRRDRRRRAGDHDCTRGRPPDRGAAAADRRRAASADRRAGPGAARRRDLEARRRGRRADARRARRVGDRGRHRHRHVHPRRQVPRADRRGRHGR